MPLASEVAVREGGDGREFLEGGWSVPEDRGHGRTDLGHHYCFGFLISEAMAYDCGCRPGHLLQYATGGKD